MTKTQQREARERLGPQAWFAELPQALRERVLRDAEVRSFRRRQAVGIGEAPFRGFGAVLAGQVTILCHFAGEWPVPVHVAGPGFWFGDFALRDGEWPLLSAAALNPVRALLLAPAALARIVADEPGHDAALARIAVERYRSLLRTSTETLRLSPECRLRLRLAELSAAWRAAGASAAAPVELGLSQSELAQFVGMSRQRLNARLRQLQAEGWLELRARRIRVVDPGGLRATALAAGAPAARTGPAAG